MSLSRIKESDRYRQFVEFLPYAVYTLDLQGRYQEVNPATEHMTGYSRDELLSMTILDLLTSEEELKRREFSKEMLATDKVNTFEATWVHKNGHHVNLNITRTPILLDDEVVGIVGIAKNVTEEKKHSPRLQEYTQRCQSLLRHHPHGICAFDVRGDVIDANPAYETLTGYSLQELRQMDVYRTLVLEKDLHWIKNIYQAGGDVHHIETQIQNKGGDRIDVRATTVPIIIDNQSVGTYVILEDTSTQERGQQQLSETKKMYQLISENTQDIITISTPDGVIRYISPSVEHLLGYTPEELTGTYAADVFHPDDRTFLIGKSDGAQGSVQDKRLTLRVRHSKGHYIWFETASKLVRNDEGVLIEVVSVGRDITDRKKSDEIISKTELLSAIGELAAGIAHEVRNPLTTLSGFLKMMHGEATVLHQRYFDIMQSEIERIESILKEMLLLAKPRMVEFSSRDIQSLIQEVVALLVSQANMKNIRIHCRFSQQSVSVNCDLNQMKQVFLNIIKNAIESMDSGGNIYLKAVVCPKSVRVDVTDEGVGISKDNIPRLGDAFFTTKEEGTGLGLMISTRIISAHHGTIAISSDVGKGTTVSVTLPLIR